MYRGRAAVLELRAVRDPPVAGENGNAQNRSKHDLREARMEHRQPVMQQLDHYLAAENGLRDDAAHRDHGQPTQPAALFFYPDQNGEDKRPYSQCACNDTMRVLVKHSANHGWGPRAKRFWPVRDG